MRIEGISVIVTCYNGAPWIREALCSVLQQTADVPLELIVVDDNSRDNTVEVIDSLHDPRVRIIRNQVNVGPAKARNQAIQEARYPWLAFNDQDDVWLSDKLARQCAILETHPELDGVAGGYARLARDGKSRWVGRLLHRRWSPSHSPRLSDPPHYQPALHGPCYIQSLLVRKQTMLQIGGFREALPIAFDPDLFLRLGEVARLGAVEDPVFLYRLSLTSMTGSVDLNVLQFLGGFAYMRAAQDARAQGRAEPDITEFLNRYQPSQAEVRQLAKDQMLRNINTRWVADGLPRAVMTAAYQILRHPSLVASLAARLRWWVK